jgi:hypothetical protein
MEVRMKIHKALLIAATVVLVAGAAMADTKIVKMEHTDGFSAMGRTVPPVDQERVTWIGTDRMRTDSGGASTIIRLDQKKLYLLNHGEKTYNIMELPIDLAQFMPPGMADQMLPMMTFEVTVTPTDETKMVGEWKARRFDVAMTSKMATISMTMWATQDVEFDEKAYYAMYEHLNSIRPGLAKMAEEMSKLEGLVIEEEGVTTMTIMGNSTIKKSEKATSIENLDPPKGTYEPPADYTEESFDFMKSMQGQ